MHAQERQALADRIVSQVQDVITVVGADGRVRFVNDASASVLGLDPQDSPGREALSWVHPDDRAVVLERRSWLLGSPGRTTTTVVRVTGADGWRHVETRGVNLLDDPEVQGLLYVTRDVEDRARTEMSLLHSLAASRAVADLGLLALRTHDLDEVLDAALSCVTGLVRAASAAVVLADADGALRVRASSGSTPVERGTRWPDGERTPAGTALAGRHAVVAEDLRADDRFALPEAFLDGRGACVDVPLPGPAGPAGVLSLASASTRLFGPVDVQLLESVAAVVAGALDRESREQAAVAQALHDPLTGLPTRPLLLDRLEQALERTRRGGGEVALMVVDLDRFKAVNDGWGHAAGDEVLRVLGPRIGACVRAADTAARYGGDEFVVLCEHDVDHRGVAQVAARIRRVCAEPVVLSSGEAVLLSASVGIGWTVEEGPDASRLLAAADAAMYREKRAG